MKKQRVIKLTIVALALLLIPRRSSPDKLAQPKSKPDTKPKENHQ